MALVRRKRLFVALLTLLATGALWWWLSPPGNYGTTRTREGHPVVLHSVSFGKKHRYVQGSWWSRPLAPLFGTNPPAQCRVRTFEITNDLETLVFWVEGESAGPINACVTDENGLESAPHAPIRSLTTSSNRWLAGFEFTSFPRRAPQFGLRLYRATPTNRAEYAEFTIRNPAPHSYPEWVPAVLPVSRRVGQDTISLVSLQTGLYHGTELSNHVGTWTEVTLDYSNGPWKVLTAELSDATGNRVSKRDPFARFLDREARVPAESIAAWSRRHAALSLEGALWLDEPAWRLRLECRQGHEADFPPEQLWTVPGVAVPAAGAVTPVNAHTNMGGAALVFAALSAENEGRQGQFRLLHAEVRVEAPPGGAFVDVVKLVDDRGTNLFKATARFSTRQHSLGLRVPPASKKLDLTFAVHRPHTVEFVLKPALLRTNIVKMNL
jgi:hypothetical protein